MIDHFDYRVALILPHSRELLGIPSPNVAEFPVVAVSRWERHAEQLTKQIEEIWKIKTIVLDILVDPGFHAPCAVVEVRTIDWNFDSDGFRIVKPDEIGDASLADSQRGTLAAILFGLIDNARTFSRIGWIEDAQQWIQSSVSDHEVIFTGDIRHLNGGGAFCLIRLGTQSGPAYWIKGVGEPNTHEFGITSFLARRCPEYLPPIVATRPDWNAWCMEEFGSSMHNSDSLDSFKHAVHQLAGLQKKFVYNSEELIAAQFADHRLGTLDSHIDEIFEYLDGAMRQQTSTKVEQLTTSRLLEIRNVLHNVCQALEELRIPDTLMHSDISPGSILWDGTGCVFTDWCEANVGNPFITFEQLCVHLGRKTDDPESWIRSLSEVYKSSWTDVLTGRQIDEALQLAPLVSVFSYLYGRGDWLHTERSSEPEFLSYSRSLARHMERLARRLESSEATCQLL